MSYNNGPRTVTSGLIMYLSPASSKSMISGSTSLLDLSTTQLFTGSITGSPSFHPTYFGGALRFNGSTNYITLPNTGIFTSSLTSDFCLDMWFGNWGGGASHHILSCHSANGDTATNGFKFSYSGTSYVLSFVYANTSYVIASHSLGERANFVMNRIGTSFKCYYNGSLVHSNTTSHPFRSTVYPLRIATRGGSSPVGDLAKMNLFSFKAYNRGLSDSELETNFSSVKTKYLPKSYPAPMFEETFEGSVSGCDNTPTTLTGDADYTLGRYRGDHSLYMTANQVGKWVLPTNQDEVWIAMAVNCNGASAFTSINEFTIAFQNVSSTTLASVYVRKQGGPTYEWYLAAAGGATVDNNTPVAHGSTEIVMLHYKKGTGANAQADAWITTNGVFGDTPTLTASDGTATTAAAYIQVSVGNYAGEAAWVDDIKVYQSKPSVF